MTLVVALLLDYNIRINHWECHVQKCSVFSSQGGAYPPTLRTLYVYATGHWPLTDGLLHLVQRGGDSAGP